MKRMKTMTPLREHIKRAALATIREHMADWRRSGHMHFYYEGENHVLKGGVARNIGGGILVEYTGGSFDFLHEVVR